MTSPPGSGLCRVGLTVTLAVLLGGCRAGVRHPKPIPGITSLKVVEAQNARVAGLERLWARASVQVTSTNDKGRRLRDQGEGHLQVVQPWSIALTLGKVGQTQLYLGSNDQLYWWIDLIDADDKVAVFGRHEFVTTAKADVLGVPIHPRDLVHLLGVTPIPDEVADQSLEWDAQSHAGLLVPAQSGSRRVWFDVSSMQPTRVEMFDADGALTLTAELDRYGFVNVVGDATLKPQIPERIDIRIASDDTLVKISLYDPENRPIRPTAFDFERLVKGLGVDTMYDLDAPPETIPQEP